MAELMAPDSPESVVAMSLRPSADAAAEPAAADCACCATTVTVKYAVVVPGGLEEPNVAVIVAFSTVPTGTDAPGVRVRFSVPDCPEFTLTAPGRPVTVRPISAATVSPAVDATLPVPWI